MREHRARPETELARAALVDHVPRDVGRHQVGRELDPSELEIKGAGERLHHQGLRDAGHPFEDHVSAHEQRHEEAGDHEVLTDHGLARPALAPRSSASRGSVTGSSSLVVAPSCRSRRSRRLATRSRVVALDSISDRRLPSRISSSSVRGSGPARPSSTRSGASRSRSRRRSADASLFAGTPNRRPSRHRVASRITRAAYADAPPTPVQA